MGRVSAKLPVVPFPQYCLEALAKVYPDDYYLYCSFHTYTLIIYKCMSLPVPLLASLCINILHPLLDGCCAEIVEGERGGRRKGGRGDGGERRMEEWWDGVNGGGCGGRRDGGREGWRRNGGRMELGGRMVGLWDGGKEMMKGGWIEGGEVKEEEWREEGRWEMNVGGGGETMVRGSSRIEW